MDYFICISISKSLVTFSYWQKGGGKPLTPFPWGEWPAPMSFYCSSSGIVIGEDAERAAANGRAGAFRDWFSLLSSGMTFEYMAKRYPINSLFLLAAEEQFRRFLREVLFDREGGLESVRGSLPLVLSFDNNVPEPYRLHVIKLFRESGYGKVLDVFGNSYIASHYGKKFLDRTVLILDSDGTDLYMALYDPKLGNMIDKKMAEGYGSDPRVGQLSNILWYKTEAESAWLSKEKEYDKLKLEAIKILESDNSEISNAIEFSGGTKLSYFITRVEVNNIHIPANMELSGVVRDFINKNHLDPEDAPVVLVLRKYAATNRYFYRNLKNYFPQIVIDSDEERDDYGNLLVADAVERLSTLSINDKSLSRDTKSESIIETDNVLTSVKSDDKKMEEMEKEVQTSNEFSHQEKRDIRTKLVMIKQKFSSGLSEDGFKIFNEVKNLIGEGIDKLPESTVKLYKELTLLLDNPTKIINTHKDAENTREKVDRHSQSYRTTSPIQPKSESLALQQPKAVEKKLENFPQEVLGYRELKHHNFILAKDLFRKAGNEKMASLCVDLNKSSRQFKVLQNQISNCVTSKNKAAAERAVKDLSKFVKELEEANLETADAKSLLKRYHTLIK